MASSALNRLETLLAARKLDGTLARPDAARMPGPLAPTGIASLDETLQGGWRRGDVSEVIGGPSSGRTGVVAATLAAATARGELVALVDTFDRLDPATLAGAGVNLAHVLWVRGPAISLPGRPPMVADTLHRAIRAFDLILRAGGFGVIVLDAVGAPARAFQDLAPATWLRLAHGLSNQPVVGLLVGDRPIGRSARGITVRLTSTRRWVGDSPQSRRLASLDIRAECEQAQRSVQTKPAWTLRAAV
jgi:RecA/RadA recombinase